MKKMFFTLVFCAVSLCNYAQEAFIGEIRMFAGNYPPRDWALCNGAILQITQYSALYSIIGITYGGNGTTNFALPDLQGRVPLGMGNGQGLSSRTIGSKGGAETATLTVAQLPMHNHPTIVTSASGTTNTASSDKLLASPSAVQVNATTAKAVNIYTTSTGNNSVQLAPSSSVSQGGNQPHDNMVPFATINFIICINGIYPSRQ